MVLFPDDFVVSDSVFALGSKAYTDWLTHIVPHDVVCGRTFRRHSWTDKLNGRKFKRIFVVCGGNDVASVKKRSAKTHIDENDLQSMRKGLEVLKRNCEELVFVLVGDWNIWKTGFKQWGDEKAESQFLSCWDQLAQEARRTSHEVILLQKGLDDLEKHDHWHFALGCAKQLSEIVKNLLIGGTHRDDGGAEDMDKPSGEEPKDSNHLRPSECVISKQARETLENGQEREHFTPQGGEDEEKKATVKSVTQAEASMKKLAAALPASGLPIHMSEIAKTEAHDLLFFGILKAARSAKSPNRLSSWRRFFTENPPAWEELRKAVERAYSAEEQHWSKSREEDEKQSRRESSRESSRGQKTNSGNESWKWREEEEFWREEESDARREQTQRWNTWDTWEWRKEAWYGDRSPWRGQTQSKSWEWSQADNWQNWEGDGYGKGEKRINREDFLDVVTFNFGAKRRRIPKHNEEFFEQIKRAHVAGSSLLLLQEASTFSEDVKERFEAEWQVFSADDLVFLVNSNKAAEGQLLETQLLGSPTTRLAKMRLQLNPSRFAISSPTYMDFINVHFHHDIAKKPHSDAHKKVLSLLVAWVQKSTQEGVRVVLAGDWNQAAFGGHLSAAFSEGGCDLRQVLKDGEECCDFLVPATTAVSANTLPLRQPEILSHGAHHPVMARLLL